MSNTTFGQRDYAHPEVRKLAVWIYSMAKKHKYSHASHSAWLRVMGLYETDEMIYGHQKPLVLEK